MEFFTGTTQLPDHSISEYQKRMLFEQAMDSNCLTWLIAIVVANQLQLHSMVSLVSLFFGLKAVMQSLPHFGADSKVAWGKRRQPRHP